jgi:mono/diheme cytochrome c family protein
MSLAALFLLPVLFASLASSPEPPNQEPDGQRLYRAACAACHGLDGRGQPRATVGFDTPLPDFTDCAFATPEPDADWFAVVHEGGPVRAFDRRMPAFGAALTEAEMLATIGYIRGFCRERAWPPGELNLPRPLVTEKAFPENEFVLSTVAGRGSAAVFHNEGLYERRLGSRAQFEIAVPLAVEKDASGLWRRGIGDAAIALKQVLFHSRDTGSIVSAAAEVVLPSGNRAQELGTGTTVFEPFVAVGQMLPADGFIQFQGGVELPWDRERAAREAFWRTAIGKSFIADRFGRSWTPMIEIVGSKPFDGAGPAEWDVVPQMQVTLSRRQHIAINAGVRVPLNHRDNRPAQVLTYFLWDWFDGALLDGWR